MSHPGKSKSYRNIIDELVSMCRDGQGQIGAWRVREGIWNENATSSFLPDQHEINLLLFRMSAEDREVLAKMLGQQVVTGVFETLKVLEQYQITPFEDGYEGSPFNDFIGRLQLQDWDWPQN